MIAFLLNVSTWPIMAWHTIDGLFLGISALWLALRTASSSRWAHAQWTAVWLMAGSAPLIKQGFAVVPVLVVLLVSLTGRARGLLYLPVAIVPGVLYLVLTRDTPGGLGGQLYSGSLAELRQPAETLLATEQSSAGILAVVAVAVSFALVTWVRRGPSLVAFTAAVIAIGPILYAVSRDLGGIYGVWPWIATITLIASTVLTITRLDLVASAAGLLGLAYATAASWGVTNPGLIAGAMVAGGLGLLAYRRQQAAAEVESPPPPGFSLATMLILAICALIVLPARASAPYRDVPRSGMSASVDDPRLALIRMSPQTAAYIDALRDCLARYPATTVAVLPDGAGLYPLLGLRNPFDSDWWWTDERSGDHEQRVAATVAQLNASDDWLVLFQSFDLAYLAGLSPDQVRTPGEPFSFVPGDIQILQRLHGRPVQCGSLTGVYRPRGSA
ncbi:MAG: hypothetical protein V9E98_00265 [Candidatus Nanopelagicales bacterium]